MPLVSEGIAAGMAKHVGMRLQIQPEAPTCRALDHPGKARGRERHTALAHEDEGRRLALTLQAPQGAQLVALKGMGAGDPTLGPTDVHDGAIEAHLIPTQVAELGRPEPMAEGDEDNGRIPVTVAVSLGGLDQGVDPRRASNARGS